MTNEEKRLAKRRKAVLEAFQKIGCRQGSISA
jgi:hypothetical protein